MVASVLHGTLEVLAGEVARAVNAALEVGRAVRAGKDLGAARARCRNSGSVIKK